MRPLTPIGFLPLLAHAVVAAAAPATSPAALDGADAARPDELLRAAGRR